MSHAPWLFQITEKQVQHITQARCSSANSMREVKPTLLRFDWCWPQSILHFFYCVILALIDDCLFLDKRRVNFVAQAPTNPAASSSFDEVVLWPRVESILS